MSQVREFFRNCPACGRRFSIRLVGEKLVNDRKDTEEMKEAAVSPLSYASQAFTNFLVVEENVPVEIDIKDFQYTYKCKHCGHIWTEMHEEESKS